MVYVVLINFMETFFKANQSSQQNHKTVSEDRKYTPASMSRKT